MSAIKSVKVLYFASAKEFLGNVASEEYSITDSIQTLADLVK